MKCLMCGKDSNESSSIYEYLFYDDLLCSNCRREWIRNKKDIYLNNIKVKSSWIYNDSFKTCLIQYKECYDEALKDVFLYPVLKDIRKYLKGYTLLLMPSTKEKLNERGFNHLKYMFQCLKLPMLDPFITKESQKGKKLEERKKASKSICLKENVRIPKKIALVDDVFTTGSTLTGALNALNLKNHKIKIYTIARVPFLDR